MSSPPLRAWRRGKSQWHSIGFCFCFGFSLSSTLLVEERAGRGGLFNIAFYNVTQPL